MSVVRLRSAEFRREREAAWRELEGLVARVEKGGVRRLSADELLRLPRLYRAALSSLSVARAISLDRNVVEYLEHLCARASFCVYGNKRHLRDAVRQFFGERLPQVVRSIRRHLLLAALVMVAGVLTGGLLTLGDSEMFYAFVDADYAGDRGPSASTATLREGLFDGAAQAGDELTAFAMWLFTHNARIGILAFALGFAAGVPTLLLMFANGLILGAFGALFHSRGLSVEFWSWVLPHGITELLAVILCGGAGLVLGESLLFPGRHTRLGNLARRGKDAAVIVLGAVTLFLVAGAIEGVFRQRVQDVPIRYAVAALTLAFWIVYLGYVGRRSAPGAPDEEMFGERR